MHAHKVFYLLFMYKDDAIHIPANGFSHFPTDVQIAVTANAVKKKSKQAWM